MPAAASASASPGSSESGRPMSFAIVAASADSATRRPSSRAGQSAGSQAPPATLANLDSRRRIDRRCGRPFAIRGGCPLDPGAGEDCAEEVLAREGDVQRATELLQLRQTVQDLQ